MEVKSMIIKLKDVIGNWGFSTVNMVLGFLMSILGLYLVFNLKVTVISTGISLMTIGFVRLVMEWPDDTIPPRPRPYTQGDVHVNKGIQCLCGHTKGNHFPVYGKCAGIEGGKSYQECDCEFFVPDIIPSRARNVQQLISISDRISEEMNRQDKKWGPQQNLTEERWHLFISEEVGEVAKAINDKEPKRNLVMELIQTAALCIQFVERIESGAIKEPTEEL